MSINIYDFKNRPATKAIKVTLENISDIVTLLGEYGSLIDINIYTDRSITVRYMNYLKEGCKALTGDYLYTSGEGIQSNAEAVFNSMFILRGDC